MHFSQTHAAHTGCFRAADDGEEAEGDDAAQDGEKRKAKANRRRAQQAQTTEARAGYR